MVDENGRPRERVGELIERDGHEVFLESNGVTAGAPDDQGPEDEPVRVLLRTRRSKE